MTQFITILLSHYISPFWYDTIYDPFGMTQYIITLLLWHYISPFWYDTIYEPFCMTIYDLFGMTIKDLFWYGTIQNTIDMTQYGTFLVWYSTRPFWHNNIRCFWYGTITLNQYNILCCDTLLVWNYKTLLVRHSTPFWYIIVSTFLKYMTRFK